MIVIRPGRRRTSVPAQMDFSTDSNRHRIDDRELVDGKTAKPIVSSSVLGSGLLDASVLFEELARCISSNNITNASLLKEKEDVPKLVEPVESKCIICMTEERDHVLVPCGHKGTCKECSRRLAQCPVCRKDVRDRIRVFEA